MTTLQYGAVQSGFYEWIRNTYGGVIPDFEIQGSQLTGGTGNGRIRVASGLCHIDATTTTFHNELGNLTYASFNNDGADFISPLTITGGLTLNSGPTINEISTDGTFLDNSDTAIPTQLAVKTYINSFGLDIVHELQVGTGCKYNTISDAVTVAAALGLSATQKAVIKVYSGTYNENVVLPAYCDLIGAGGHPTAVTITANGDNVPMTIDNSAGVTVNAIKNVSIYSGVSNNDAIARPTLTQSSFVNPLSLTLQDCIIERENACDSKHDEAVVLAPIAWPNSISMSYCYVSSTNITDTAGVNQAVGSLLHGTGIWNISNCRFVATGTSSEHMACILNDDTYPETEILSIGNQFVTENAGGLATAIFSKYDGDNKFVSISDIADVTATGGFNTSCFYGVLGTSTITNMIGKLTGTGVNKGICLEAGATTKSANCLFDGATLLFDGTFPTGGVATDSDNGAMWISNTASPPTENTTGIIKIYAQDSPTDLKSTLGLYTEQSVDVGAPTFSNKLKVVINGTEYWLGLDAV